MDEKFQKLKQITKKVLRNATRPFIRVIAIIMVIAIFINGAVYITRLDDATYKEGDKKNVPYAVEQHTSDVSIDANGNILSSKTAKELWDEMIKNGSRVDEYLDGPEELLKMINAEMVTNYLDTREDPDEPIDWDNLNKDINSTTVQGIIKLKRAFEDGSTKTITYVDPETFQSYIDDYNVSGSDEDKEKALSHFTLEKGYNSSTSFGTGESITAGTVINIPTGLGSVHTYMGWQCITSTTSTQYKLREQAGMNFDSEGFGKINGRYVIACTTTFGKVGDYIDFYQEDGTVIQCIIGDIKSQNDAGCNAWGHLNGTCIIEFVVDKDTWYNSGHPNPGQQGFHTEWNQNLTKAINGGSYFDNPTFGSSTITGNTTSKSSTSTASENTISGNVMKWPTEGTTITSWFGLRNDPMGSGGTENHGAIDIAVSTGTNVYATEAGTVITASMCGTAGNMVTIDHGNGYITKYMHNSSFKVSVGDKVEKGQVIALSGSTGRSTGPHVHFQIEYNGVKVDPLTFKYDNGMGDGTGGIGSNSSSLSTNSTIYAKVATWNETTDTVTSNDPSVEDYSRPTYNMTSTKINYQELVSGYQMPFDYLWALLVVGQDKDFIFDLAELVYDSQIEITVHDNLTKVENYSKDTYTNKTKVITQNVNVNVEYINSNTYWDEESKQQKTKEVPGSFTRVGGPFEDELEDPYTTEHTVTTWTNTLDIKLTRANVWFVDYSQTYTYEVPEEVEIPHEIPYQDEEYPETPDKSDNTDGAGLGEAYRKKVQAECEKQYQKVVKTRIHSLKSDYYYKSVDRKVTGYTKTNSNKYVASPAKSVEKTEKQSKEPNFVTLYRKYRKFANNIESATDWLFEILEKGKNTIDMVDLTKYLLYKANGHNYGVTEFDFSIYEFKQVSSITGNIGWNWTCAHENYALWAYCNGKTGNYSQYYVKNYITEDKSLYYMQGDSTSNGSRNYGYGVCIYVGGTYMQHTFQNYGIDITEAQYQNFGVSTLPVEIVDNVSRDIWMSKREEVIKTIQNLGYSESDFESYQIDCLTDIRYQGWYIENIITTYMQKGICEDVYYSSKAFYAPVPGNSGTHSRGEDRWLLFSQGRYVISDTNGTVLDELSASDFSGSGNFSVDTVTAGGYTYPHYLQKDYPGAYGTSTIPRAGCGPTSLAMILAGLKGDETITPTTVVANINAYWPSGSYYVPGVGSSHCIFNNAFVQKYYGVSSQYGIGESAALSALDQGYPVIGGEDGHILAIIPAPDEYKKQGYRFYIMDSARGHDGPYRSIAEANKVVQGNLNFLAIIKP